MTDLQTETGPESTPRTPGSAFRKILNGIKLQEVPEASTSFAQLAGGRPSVRMRRSPSWTAEDNEYYVGQRVLRTRSLLTELTTNSFVLIKSRAIEPGVHTVFSYRPTTGDLSIRHSLDEENPFDPATVTRNILAIIDENEKGLDVPTDDEKAEFERVLYSRADEIAGGL